MESQKLRRRAVKELAKGHTANQYGGGPFSLIHSLLFIKCLLHRRPWEAELQRQSLPALLLVSLLEQTKFRVNGSGSELQVLLKPLWDPGQAIPGVDNWDMLREMVLVLQNPRDRSQAYWPRQKGLVHFPYVWCKPRLTGLQGTLRTNLIHFFASEKDCIYTVLCQRASAREPLLFKNLVKQSLYLQTGEFKGIPVPLNSEHS